MKRPSVRRTADAAFTLIELLTVITIICILMAMLFPFITGAKETARKKKAEQDTREIVHAIEQYSVEYSQYPKVDPTATPPTGAIPDEKAGDAVVPGMGARNATIFNTLRDIDKTPNADHIQNPRHVVFLQGKAVSNAASPRDGFLESGGTGSAGSWYDPWGSEYNIVIDSNSDNLIDVGSYYNDFQGANAPRVTVGCFSIGKDKQLGNKGDLKYKTGADFSDDLVSWSSH